MITLFLFVIIETNQDQEQLRMLSYNSLTKQMYINRFTVSNDLSNDLSNEIKSFCFYDTKTWELMNFIKYKKNKIHNLFKTSTISRANPYDLYFGDANTEEQWVFWAYDDDDGPNKQFQAFSCKCCGNYKIIANETYYTEKIICHCIVDEFADLPPLIEIMSDDDDDDFDDDSIGV